MAGLTDEQKLYIKEHPEESSITIGRKLGIRRQQAYYWMRKFHGTDVTFSKKEGLSERQRIVLELYPTHSASEIGKMLGVTKEAVNGIAHRLGVKHTDETNERMMRECIFKATRPDVVRQRTEKLKRVIARERLRIISGEKQQTRLKLTKLPNKSVCARHYLVRKYKYFYDKDCGELLILFYDDKTERLPPERERYYTNTYHIKFERADG